MSRARRALPILAATVAVGAASPSASEAAPAFSFQPQLGLPGGATIVGASPGQAPGEVWATAAIGSVPATAADGQQVKDATVLLRHAQGTGWQVVPVAGGGGEELAFSGTPGFTYDGGVVALSADATTIITSDPGGAFAQAPAPPTTGAGAVLESGESLSGTFAALDEPAGTGALVVPAGLSSTDPGVLRYDGTQWTREPICARYDATESEPCTRANHLSVKAIAASSPQNAWLLASGAGGALMLFKRIAEAGSGPPVWVQSQPASWAPSGDLVSALKSGQMLTVSSQGVWVDATLHTPTVPSADLSLLLDASSPSTVLGTWCYPQAACGQGSLGERLPEAYASFAWPGSGLGTRIIAGLEGGALLRFQGSGSFQYAIGGGASASPEAAFASPEEGWVSAGGGQGASLERITTNPATPALGAEQAWPLPFRRPLLAIAPEPGTTPGDPNTEALAVGDQGQIARYIPGEKGGWVPEYLYNAAGAVQTPRLRGVAWPEPNRAYAVGDEGAMWIWRSETGLWEPDPAEPLGFHANLTAVAFSPLHPAVGYAVGKQGTLLAYDKTWTQQALPPGLEQADFTSIAFAGSEALATYRMVSATGAEVGGLIVNEGSGWLIDPSAQALLAQLPNSSETVLSKVAGLPDGGAVAAGPGVVIERDSTSSPWRFSREPLPEAQNIAALAAFRAGPEVRALVSIDLSPLSNPNNPEPGSILELDQVPLPVEGQPAGLVGPDPLPVTGYLLGQTAEGWQDLEQQAYPNTSSILSTDLPNWPDAVLALDVDPSGAEGWAVGGQTAGLIEKSSLTSVKLTTQTATALRLGPGPPPPQSSGAAIPTPAEEAKLKAKEAAQKEKREETLSLTPQEKQAVSGEQVTFAVGGNAQCAGPCADLANEGPGPDAWLSGAVSSAARIPGLRAFLYTGARVAEGAGQSLSASEFEREMQAYAGDLSGAGSLPVRVAASPSDVDSAGGLSTFAAVLGADAGAGSVPPGTEPPPAGSAAYVYDSEGEGGPVRVIVLDYAASTLAPGELQWLAGQLDAAREVRVPAIVMGNADVVKPNAPNHAADAAEVERVLLERGASAYLFDSPGENLDMQIGSGADAIPAFGTGTLGYVSPPIRPEEFLGASGYLLVSVNVGQRNKETNRAPVTVKPALIPDISRLALDPTDGTLLRRSQVALFQALARRPAGGLELMNPNDPELAPDPYVPIPETCIGADCGQFIEPAYTFSSSEPDKGNFVEQEPNSLNPRAVLEGPDGKPVPDPHSGLFCAFNAGTPTVSITTGGLTYSMKVTIQAGSVEQPCGTVPLVNPPAKEVSASAPVAALPPSTPPAGSPAPLALAPPPPPPPPPPPANPPAAPPPRVAPPPAPFFTRPLASASLVAVPLIPPPVLARPIPPSGTAPVTVFSPAVAPEEKREEEEAVESARNSMAAYYHEAPTLPPTALIALIVLAAGAGASVRRAGRSRRHRRTAAPAWALTQTRTRRL
jgi:hypothetical protein